MIVTSKKLSSAATSAIERIESLRKFPVPATEKAVQYVLRGLGLADLTEVTTVLDNIDRDSIEGNEGVL